MFRFFSSFSYKTCIVHFEKPLTCLQPRRSCQCVPWWCLPDPPDVCAGSPLSQEMSPVSECFVSVRFCSLDRTLSAVAKSSLVVCVWLNKENVVSEVDMILYSFAFRILRVGVEHVMVLILHKQVGSIKIFVIRNGLESIFSTWQLKGPVVFVLFCGIGNVAQ